MNTGIAEPAERIFIGVLENMLGDKTLAVELVFVEFGVAVIIFHGQGFLVDKFYLIQQTGKINIASRVQRGHCVIVVSVNCFFCLRKSMAEQLKK